MSLERTYSMNKKKKGNDVTRHHITNQDKGEFLFFAFNHVYLRYNAQVPSLEMCFNIIYFTAHAA